jgi:hypothetical protein
MAHKYRGFRVRTDDELLAELRAEYAAFELPEFDHEPPGLKALCEAAWDLTY